MGASRRSLTGFVKRFEQTKLLFLGGSSASRIARKLRVLTSGIGRHPSRLRLIALMIDCTEMTPPKASRCEGTGTRKTAVLSSNDRLLTTSRMIASDVSRSRDVALCDGAAGVSS